MAQPTAPFQTGGYSLDAQQTFEAAEDLAPYVRTKLNASGKMALCGATDKADAVMMDEGVDISAEEDWRNFVLLNTPGTVIMCASGAITANAKVFAAADGKIAATGTVLEGRAVDAASGDGSLIRVIPEVTSKDFYASATTVSAAQAAANSNDGRADIDTGFGAAPTAFWVMVLNASDGIMNTGYAVSALSGGDLGKIRVDGVSGGVQLDENDVVHVIAVR